MLTLIGTPPNIVVSNQLQAAGMQPFSFFAFTPIGVIAFIIGLAYMLVIGRRLLPEHTRPVGAADRVEEAPTPLELAAIYRLPDNLFRVRVRRGSPMVGQTLAQTKLRSNYHVNVLEIQPVNDQKPQTNKRSMATPETVLQIDDVLYVKGRAEDVSHLANEQVLGIMPRDDGADPLSQELGVVEALLTPRSQLIGRTLQETRFRDTYGVTALAMLRLGKPIEGRTSQTELRFGDTLLVQGTWEHIAQLREERNSFVVVGQQRELTATRYETRRAPIAIASMLGMLVLITFNLLPTVTAVLLAAAAMVLTRCITVEEVYRTMNWESIVLIAGMLPMATALEKTGGMQLIATALTESLGAFGPIALMAGLFVLTSLFSQFISNTATTVLMAPIALQAAAGLGVTPEAFLMAVAIAASTAFATPIASPVNTLVLGPGGYRFLDFARVGVPLQLLVMIAALAALPMFFPL
jgi:di/tricarboxylate transporter